MRVQTPGRTAHHHMALSLTAGRRSTAARRRCQLLQFNGNLRRTTRGSPLALRGFVLRGLWGEFGNRGWGWVGGWVIGWVGGDVHSSIRTVGSAPKATAFGRNPHGVQ